MIGGDVYWGKEVNTSWEADDLFQKCLSMNRIDSLTQQVIL